jgi:uncharacterized protein DUF6542
MAQAHTADAWQPGGGRPDRSFDAPRSRPDRMDSARVRPDRIRPDRAGRDRMGPDRTSRERGSERSSRPVRTGASPQARGAASRRDAGYRRGSEGRPVDPRAAGRDIDRDGPDERRPSARPTDGTRERSKPTPTDTRGGRFRGVVAVLGVFFISLAGAGVDSFVGIGLGLVTLICLVASTVFATLLVRRSDLLSVVVAPPLVFVAVAAVNISLAPSAHFNLPTIATLLVRGFPTMAIATGAAIVLGLFRLFTRR